MSNEQNLKTKSVALLLIFLAGMQGLLIVNIQLLFEKRELFPHLYFSGFLGDLIFTSLACLYLITKRNSFNSLEWWAGFTIMAIPYCYLKGIGVYYDYTAYQIAHAEGRTISGGAAFGHLFLVAYLMGPAQLLSFVGFRFANFLRKKLKT